MRGGVMEATPTNEPPRRGLWRSLRDDPAFRTTFLFVFVVPALLGVGLVVWVVRAMATH